MWKWLSGKKVHILSTIGAVTTIAGFVPGVGVIGLLPVLLDFVTSPDMQSLLEFGMVSGGRHALAKLGANK